MKILNWLFGREYQQDKLSTGNKAQSLQGKTIGSMDESYKAIDHFWKTRNVVDGKVAITFVTYFRSKDVMFKAFNELSFAEIDDGSMKLPDGISATAQVITDKNRIVLLFLTGRFNKQQAKEIIPIFSSHADYEANKKYLADAAASFALELQKKGGGTIVWTDWSTEPSR